MVVEEYVANSDSEPGPHITEIVDIRVYEEKSSTPPTKGVAAVREALLNQLALAFRPIQRAAYDTYRTWEAGMKRRTCRTRWQRRDWRSLEEDETE